MIAYSLQHSGNSILEMISGDSGKDLLIKMDDHVPAAGVMEFPCWSPDGASLAFVLSGPTHPGQIWIFHRDRRRVERILDAGVPEALARRLVEPEIIEYETKDGERIEAFLYGGDGKTPASRAVVWLHDGPRGQWRNVWSPEVQTLVSRGCVVLAPNFRGSTGYGVGFESLNDRRWGDLEFPDILGAADHLRRGGLLAPDARVAVGGVGYGGFLALLIAARERNAWDGVISLGGWVDLEDTFHRSPSTLQREILDEVGDPASGEDWFTYLSPLKHGARIRCPVLLVSMDGHARVAKERVRDLGKMLRRQGTPLEMEILKKENRGRVLRLLDDFVEDHL
jgi:dipeptidyl aminopeptidase/acylaminoacyl peptidase